MDFVALLQGARLQKQSVLKTVLGQAWSRVKSRSVLWWFLNANIQLGAINKRRCLKICNFFTIPLFSILLLSGVYVLSFWGNPSFHYEMTLFMDVPSRHSLLGSVNLRPIHYCIYHIIHDKIITAFFHIIWAPPFISSSRKVHYY